MAIDKTTDDAIDLDPKDREIVVGLLRKHVPGCEVRAYGSRVKWKAKQYSDLDLAVFGASSVDRLALSDLREALENSDLPFRVDVMDWETIPDSFRSAISSENVVLQEGHQIRLGDVTEVIMGQSPPGDTVSRENGYPLLNGPTEFGDHNPSPVQYTTDPRRFAKKGDILFCVRGSTTGRMNWADQDYAIGRGIAAIRLKGAPHLQHLLRGAIEYHLPALLNQATGSTFPNISRDQLRNLPFPDLPIESQEQASSALRALDEAIELSRRMCETLEEMALALFKAWFVDFEPARAKMEGRWLEGESLPGLPAHLYDLFPDDLVDSELGPIPAGWRPCPLGDVIRIHDSRRVPLSKRERQQRKGPFRYYGATGIVDYVDDFLFDGRFVLVGEDGTVVNDDGAPVVQYVWGRFWVNNHAHVLSSAGRISTEHLQLLLRGVNIRPFVTGAVQLKLNQRNLKSIPILTSSDRTVTAFEDIIAPQFAALRQAHDELHLLVVLRDLLLPKLISGEVRLPVAT